MRDKHLKEVNNISNFIFCNNEPIGPTNSYSYFIGANPPTSFNKVSVYPQIDKTAFIGPFSSVIGDVRIDKEVFLASNVVLRADEGTNFYIGYKTNIQDGVILHGLEHAQLTVDNKKYSIYIGSEVSIAHGTIIHGPCVIGDKVFVGFKAIVFDAIVEEGCYIELGAIVTGGVRIPPGRYVPVGEIIDTQEKANKLSRVPQSKEEFAKKVVKVNTEFANSYSLKYGGTRCSCGLCCDNNTLIHD